MRKTFCDHCCKEIKGLDINELDCDDCFFDSETRKFVGEGYTLCEKCLVERHQLHINLDMNFLNIVEEGMK